MTDEQQSVYDRAAEQDLRAVHGPKLRVWDWVPGLLYNPKKVFLAVRVRGPRAGDFIIPLALVIVSTMLFAAAVYYGGAADQIYKSRHGIAETEQIPVDQQHSAERFLEGIPTAHEAINPLTWIMAFTMGFLWLTIIGSVVLFAVRIIGKKPLNFMGALALTGISSYALFMQTLLMALLVVITGSWITADPATWFGSTGEGALEMLSYLNPFNLYAVALIGYGAHLVAKVEKQRAVIIAAVLWALPVIVKGVGLLLA